MNGSESEVNGLAIVDKPPGCTSHDVVDRIRRLFEIKRVGHSGTLDPSATGMLLVGVGKATRLLAFLQGLPKSYQATAKFGITTTSQDAQGEVVEIRPSAIDAEMIQAAMAKFQGEIMQVPPMVSAVKIDGEPLYKAARRGEEVDRPARSVRIYEFRLAEFDEQVQTATFAVRCSSGTYVRTLAADLGEALRTGAHLIALRRTSIGDFEEAEATPLEELESMGREAASAKLLSLSEAMRGFPIKRVGGPDLIAVTNGRALELGEAPSRPGELTVLATPRPGDRPSHEAGMSAGIPVAIHDLEGRLVAVYRKTGKGLKPAAVLGH